MPKYEEESAKRAANGAKFRGKGSQLVNPSRTNGWYLSGENGCTESDTPLRCAAANGSDTYATRKR